MWSHSKVVLVSLVSILCLLSGVASDSKTFPYSPTGISGQCTRDPIYVQFLIDIATPDRTGFQQALTHASNIASGILSQSSTNIAVLSVYRSNTVSTVGSASTPTQFAAFITTALSSYTSGTGTATTVAAVNTAATSIGLSSYTRRIIFVITGNAPSDFSTWYTARKPIEQYGLEVFVEGVNVNYAQSQQLVTIASAQVTQTNGSPIVNHYINATSYGSLNSDRRAVVAMRRDIGGTCSVFSGANYVTYDGISYSPNAANYSVLTQTIFATSDTRMRVFTVVANNAANDVSITTNSDTLRFVWSNGELQTTLNGKNVIVGAGRNNIGDTAVYVALSQLYAGKLGMLINVTSSFNDVVQLGFYDNPYILVTPNYDLFGHLVGLCGTYDSCPNNEFVGFNGLIAATSVQLFVDSWSVGTPYYNTQLWTSFGSVYASGSSAITSAADKTPYNEKCNQLSGYLQKACAYDVNRIGESAAAVYRSIQASTCEAYCQSGVISTSYLTGSQCDQFCLQNYPPFDLHNVTSYPMSFYDVQTVNGFKKYAQVYLGGTYVIKATDPQGIIDYTSLQYNCSEDLTGISAGNSVTVTRNPQLGFPYVQLFASVPPATRTRPVQYSWKALTYPYIGQDDNTTSADVIAAQAPVIIAGTSLTPKFAPTRPGVYTFELAAYDGCLIKTSTVSVTAVCDNCLFTSRVEATTTSFYNYPASFDQASYQAYTYSAPLYPSPAVSWNITNFDAYNVRGENITWLPSSVNSNHWDVIFTNGTTGHATINTTTLPDETAFDLGFNQQPSPYVAYPITLTNQLVVKATEAVITKHFLQQMYYLIESEVVNTVAVPIETFNTVKVCSVDLTEYSTSNTAKVQWTPLVNHVADYCTGKYTIELFSEDVCHNSSDSFITQVNCNSRPILNAPGCKSKNLQVYTPVQGGWFPATLDGSVAYDTEEYYTQLYYNWVLVSKPFYSNHAQPLPAGNPTLVFTPDQAGDYVFSYTVSDGCRTESYTYTLTATCEIERHIHQVVTPDYLVYNGIGNQAVSFVSTGENATVALNPLFQTIITPPQAISALPVFNKQYQRLNGRSGAFVPTYKGDWLISYSAFDDCGVLNQTGTVVTFACPDIQQSIAVVTASTLEVETSNAVFPAITFDGSQSKITSTSYTANPQYNWYWRPAGSTSVADYKPIAGGAIMAWRPPQAGRFEVFLIFSDGCEYATTTTTVTAVCDQAVPSFVIDQYLADGTKTTNSGFQFYGPGATILFLNATASQNASFYEWSVTTLNGDYYSYQTYQLTNDETNYATLSLTFPPMASGFSVQLSVISACPGAIPVNQTFQKITTTCNQDFADDGKNNNFIPGVTFTSDVDSVGFKDSNRFDSVTLTANNVDPALVYYYKFLITDASNKQSIYYPNLDQVSHFSTPNVVTRVGYLNDTDYSGLYTITETTTTLTEVHVFDWIAIEPKIGNTSYEVCFTPDLPGTYTIHAEIRDLCNNTFTKAITITAGCTTPISTNFAQNINVDTTNFRDLARVTIDASGLSNPSGNDLKFRWALSEANGTFADGSFNGTYYDLEQNTDLTNWYGSVVSFVLPYSAYDNTYSARYDIWDGCQMTSGFVNVTIPSLSHRPIFIDSVPAPVNGSTAAIPVKWSDDSATIATSQYVNSVKQDVRMTECFSSQITMEVVDYRGAQLSPPAPAPKPGVKKSVIIGAVVGSVGGALVIGAAAFGIMKYKARSVAV